MTTCSSSSIISTSSASANSKLFVSRDGELEFCEQIVAGADSGTTSEYTTRLRLLSDGIFLGRFGADAGSNSSEFSQSIETSSSSEITITSEKEKKKC